jgi:acetolactate synthase-1/3 small subunit
MGKAMDTDQDQYQGQENKRSYASSADSQIEKDEGFFTLSLLVANSPGVLGRVALVFSRRGFNIESLNVSHTLDRRFSRMVIISKGSPKQLDDISKQSRNLVDVIHFSVLDSDQNSARKDQKLTVDLWNGGKAVVLGIVEEFKYRVVDFTDSSITVEAQSSDYEFETFVQMIKHYGNISI